VSKPLIYLCSLETVVRGQGLDPAEPSGWYIWQRPNSWELYITGEGREGYQFNWLAAIAAWSPDCV
jgi:hypothetical protein